MTTITEERVRAVLRNSPLLSAEDYQHLTAQANMDADEGADWLPYYKIALGVLMMAFGSLEAVATGPHNFDPKSRREVVADALALAKLSNLPCGIGPDESPEQMAAVWESEERARDAPAVTVSEDDGEPD